MPQYKLKSGLKSVHIHINLKIKYKKHEQVKDTVKPVCCVQCYIVKLVWPRKLFSSPNRAENKLGQSKNICLGFPTKNIFQWSHDCVLRRIIQKALSNVSIQGTSEQQMPFNFLSHLHKIHSFSVQHKHCNDEDCCWLVAHSVAVGPIQLWSRILQGLKGLFWFSHRLSIAVWKVYLYLE